MFCKIAILKQ